MLLFKKYYYICIIWVTLVALFAIASVDTYLKNNAAPHGILSFELAQTPEKSMQIVQSWEGQAKIYAAFSLGIDYLFLVFYTLFFILTSYKLSRSKSQFFQKLAIIVSLVFLLAGIFDAFENYYLLQILTANISYGYAEKAALFARLKFGFLFLGIVYLLITMISKLKYTKN